MINNSEIDVLNFVESVLKENGIERIYKFNMPEALSKEDENKGFAVINIGKIHDSGQFPLQAYAECVAYIDVYIKSLTNTTLNERVFKEYETKIRHIFESEVQNEHYAMTSDNTVGGGSFTDELRNYHILSARVQIIIN
jgi:hypothetical protein